MISQDKRFNIFMTSLSNTSNYSYDQYQRCPVHPGVRLLKSDDPKMLMCPTCGSLYKLKEETVTDQDIQPNVAPSTAGGTKIISGKRKRKFYDSFANLIPDDESIKQDIAAGRTIVYYHEQKVEDTTAGNKFVRKTR